MHYTKAYNQIDKFIVSKFDVLFIQLYANHEIIEKMIKEGIVLDPSGTPSFRQTVSSYYESLKFLTTIREREARIFYKAIIAREKIVPFPLLEEIDE